MTRDLAAEVETFLRANPGSTSTEIAEGIRARRQEVQKALIADVRFAAELVGVPYTRREWSVRHAGGDRLSGRRERSQADRLLECLRDGYWWSTAALLQKVPCIVHSRIAALRDQGHVIEHMVDGVGADHHFYRLVAAEGRREAA